MTNPGHELAALRPQVPHVCPVCGQTFLAIRTARTCSNACRKRLHRQGVKATKEAAGKNAEVKPASILKSTRRASRKWLYG